MSLAPNWHKTGIFERMSSFQLEYDLPYDGIRLVYKRYGSSSSKENVSLEINND